MNYRVTLLIDTDDDINDVVEQIEDDLYRTDLINNMEVESKEEVE